MLLDWHLLIPPILAYIVTCTIMHCCSLFGCSYISLNITSSWVGTMSLLISVSPSQLPRSYHSPIHTVNTHTTQLNETHLLITSSVNFRQGEWSTQEGVGYDLWLRKYPDKVRNHKNTSTCGKAYVGFGKDRWVKTNYTYGSWGKNMVFGDFWGYFPCSDSALLARASTCCTFVWGKAQQHVILEFVRWQSRVSTDSLFTLSPRKLKWQLVLASAAIRVVNLNFYYNYFSFSIVYFSYLSLQSLPPCGGKYICSLLKISIALHFIKKDT